MHSGIPPSLILGPYDLAVMAVRGQRALIVTTGRSRGSLAALRALSEAGWYVGVGIPETKGMVTTSKWCRHRHLIPRPRGDAEEFVAALAEAVAIGEYDVVFGGGDDTVAALAAARDRIPARVAHPPIDRVIAALDKIELATRARAVGLAAPRTEVATEATLANGATMAIGSTPFDRPGAANGVGTSNAARTTNGASTTNGSGARS